MLNLFLCKDDLTYKWDLCVTSYSHIMTGLNGHTCINVAHLVNHPKQSVYF